MTGEATTSCSPPDPATAAVPALHRLERGDGRDATDVTGDEEPTPGPHAALSRSYFIASVPSSNKTQTPTSSNTPASPQRICLQTRKGRVDDRRGDDDAKESDEIYFRFIDGELYELCEGLTPGYSLLSALRKDP